MDFKLAVWNIRGMSTSDKQKEVRDLISGEKLQLCGIVETHIKYNNLQKVGEKVFGNWECDNNGEDNSKGCRIMVGWNQNKLRKVITNGVPWVILGDFNVTMKMDEQSYGCSRISNDMNEFRECIGDIEVEDILSSGFQFTWTKSLKNPNCKTLKKLDRIMINEIFLEKYSQAHGVFLPYLISDHSPAILRIPNAVNAKKKAFGFSNFVIDKREFLLIVRDVWQVEIEGFIMYQVVKKLKLMKARLNHLSWQNGDVFDRVTKLKEQLKSVQHEVDCNPHNEVIKTKSCKVLNDYNEARRDEKSLLMQKAKVEWLKSGDMNTAFFHKIIKGGLHKGGLMSICNEQGKKFENDRVAEQFFKHFQAFLRRTDEVDDFARCNINFPKQVSHEEANRMIRGISNVEIKNAMFEIEDSKAPGEVNATLISLVPKIQTPNKSAFIVGRHITDNILLAHELFKGYNRKQRVKKVSFKIDLQKAYDTINWDFLRSVLLKFGFPVKMVEWIMMCVCSTKFSISINGDREGYFKGGRGLRQGILFFCHGDIQSVSAIKCTLEEFSKYSGLKANMGKSNVFFSGMNDVEQQVILDLIPFAVGRLRVKYLGVPLITKKITKADCKPMIEKVKNRIYWASVFLLPKNVIDEINKVLKGFLWCNGDLTRVLLIKQLWNVASKKNTLWVKWITTEKLKGRSIWEVSADSNSSAGWKDLLRLRDRVKVHLIWKIDNGETVNAWSDKWDTLGPICDIVSYRDIHEAELSSNTSVAQLVSTNGGNWPEGWSEEYPELKSIRLPELQNGSIDRTVWVDNNGIERVFGTRYVWEDMKCTEGKVQWHPLEIMVEEMERNSRIFMKENRDVNTLVQIIKENVRLKLAEFEVKESKAVKEAERIWNVKFKKKARI
ncbi:RNA-directed DNA polymerase, eukaryota, reverse transcriptase zinc-binding domain protein [Tanacetum coccineum]